MSIESKSSGQSINVRNALEKLNAILPLAQRQHDLPVPLQKLHRRILQSLADTGMTLSREQMSGISGITDIAGALARLKQEDLIILDSANGEVLGAYPMTTEPTPHRLNVEGVLVNAMCAVDALSVAPVFSRQVEIRSQCHVSGSPVFIHQSPAGILDAQPGLDIMVGIRWQSTQGCAAHSLCMEMVFLRDGETARQWPGEDHDHKTLLGLEEAVALGIAFFRPLLEGPA